MGSTADELRRVGYGLRLVFLSLIVLLINVFAVLGVVVAYLQPGKNPASLIASIHIDHPTAFMVLTGLWVLSSVLGLMGKAYCLSIPAASGASSLIMLAVGCSGIGLLVNLAGQMAEVTESTTDVLMVSRIFTFAGYYYFVRFLRRLAGYLGSARLLGRSKVVLGGSLVLIIAFLAAELSQAAGVISIAAVVVGLMLVIGIVIVFSLYTLLIHDLRRTTEGAATFVADRGD